MAKHNRSRHLIGVDIGGTKIAAGIVDVRSGKIGHSQEIPTDAGRGGEAVLRSVMTLIEALKSRAEAEDLTLHGTGLAICEIVDSHGKLRSGAVIDWRNFKTAGHLVSDVRAAALAESVFGVAKGLRHVLYVSIGTGIASVPLINGVPYSGAHGAALVLATAPHLSVCGECGQTSHFTLEKIASGPALAHAFGGGPAGDAREVLAAAVRGDEKALKIISQATTLLGNAIGQLANCLDPQAIVIGGGLGSAPGFYWLKLQEQIGASLWKGISSKIDIMQSALGANAGLIGAALAIDTKLR